MAHADQQREAVVPQGYRTAERVQQDLSWLRAVSTEMYCNIEQHFRTRHGPIRLYGLTKIADVVPAGTLSRSGVACNEFVHLLFPLCEVYVLERSLCVCDNQRLLSV